MNKNDLIAAVANSTGLSKSDSASAVDSVFDAIAGALKGGDEVRLVGFGTFSVTKRAATTGREDGFREIDYFHGIGHHGYPIAQILEDGMDVTVMAMLSAMPGQYLDNAVSTIK